MPVGRPTGIEELVTDRGPVDRDVANPERGHIEPGLGNIAVDLELTAQQWAAVPDGRLPSRRQG